MEYLAENMAQILTIITTMGSLTLAITSFIKAFKSEGRTTVKLSQFAKDIKVTREGIVQGFKDAVITKDLKVSINKQVEKILDERLNKFYELILKSEQTRTKMAYWNLKILSWTAAAGKLTTEEQAEITELMALIAEEEQIVETL